MRMAGMRVAAQGVEDEDVEISEQWKALFRDVAHVGEIGGGPEAVAGDGFAAVGDGDAEKARAEEIDCEARFCRDAVQPYAGTGGVAVDLAEGVLEDALDDVGGGVVGVEWEFAAVAEGEGAEVVHAEDVVGVTVGVEHGVEMLEVLADGLVVEVLAGVDEEVTVVVGKQDRRARASVA